MRSDGRWALAWPAPAAVQRALLIHRLLGMVLAVTAVCAFLARQKPATRWLQLAWPVLLLAAAALLALYREPSGAFH